MYHFGRTETSALLVDLVLPYLDEACMLAQYANPSSRNTFSGACGSSSEIFRAMSRDTRRDALKRKKVKIGIRSAESAMDDFVRAAQPRGLPKGADTPAPGSAAPDP